MKSKRLASILANKKNKESFIKGKLDQMSIVAYREGWKNAMDANELEHNLKEIKQNDCE